MLNTTYTNITITIYAVFNGKIFHGNKLLTALFITKYTSK